MNTAKFQQIEKRINKYNKLSTAIAAIRKHYIKLHLIILGDDNLVWVVTPTDGEWLTKNGYQYADY